MWGVFGFSLLLSLDATREAERVWRVCVGAKFRWLPPYDVCAKRELLSFAALGIFALGSVGLLLPRVIRAYGALFRAYRAWRRRGC